MAAGSEKDRLLKDALEEILSIRIEGAIYNRDFLGYWALLQHHLMNISIGSFRNGLNEFYTAIQTHDNKKELTSYNFRILTRLTNSEGVVLAASNVYQTFSKVLLEKQYVKIDYDMIINGVVCELNYFEKILLLMHIYQDSLDTNFIFHQNEYILEQAKKKVRNRN